MLAFGQAAQGQSVCDPRWLASDALPGVDGRVNALALLDTDGEGPAAPELFIAGEFTAAGGVLARNIVRWDGASWRAMGAGLSHSANALTVFDPDAEGPASPLLVVGGEFTHVDGAPALRVASWDGTSWSALGGGISGSVRALTVYDPDGPGPATPNLIAAGSFVQAGGIAASRIARWNGEQWSPLGLGVSSTVNALEVFQPEGSDPLLIAGGSFTGAGGLPASRIAAWNGVTWSALVGGTGGTVSALEVFKPFDAPPVLVVGGQFSSVSGVVQARNIAAWNGTVWSALGAGFQSGVLALKVADAGGTGQPSLFAAGAFTESGGTTVRHVARWDGGQWNPLGTGTSTTAFALESFDPDAGGPEPASLIVGGVFNGAGGTVVKNLAAWDSVGWNTLGPGTDELINAITTFDPDGSGPTPTQLVVGGGFTTIGGTPASRLAIGDGVSWSPVGTGTGGVVSALTTWDPDDSGPQRERLVVAGTFARAGSVVTENIATWDGQDFAPLSPQGLNFPQMFALLTLDFDGPSPEPTRLIAAGEFVLGQPSGDELTRHLAFWDGDSWEPIGTGSMTGYAVSMTAHDFDGGGPEPARLVVGGDLTDIDRKPFNRVAFWNGTSWNGLGAGLGLPTDSSQIVLSVASFDPDAKGPLPAQLLAAGTFQVTGAGLPALRMARWNGTEWEPFAGGADTTVARLIPYRLAESDPVRLLALGQFETIGGVPASRIATWDGKAWSSFGSGLGQAGGAIPSAAAVFQPAGSTSPRLLVGGLLTRAGPVVSASLAQLGVDTAVWAAPQSGLLESDDRWVCSHAPGVSERIRFDASQAAYAPGAFTVGMLAGEEPTRVRTFAVATDDVTLDLAGRSLEVSGENPTLGGAGLTVGDTSSNHAALRIMTSGPVLARLWTRGLNVLGGNPTTPSMLHLSGQSAALEVTGQSVIGSGGGGSAIVIDDQAAANFTGSLVMAAEAADVASCTISGSGTALRFTLEDAAVAVGVRGRANFVIGGGAGRGSAGATVQSAARLGTVSFGTIGGATADVSITGTGTRWGTSQRRLFVGYAGTGRVDVLAGAMMETDTSEELVVSRFNGASGSVRVSGNGSRWREHFSPISIGPGGTLAIEDDAVVEAPALILLRGGTLTGDASFAPLAQAKGVLRSAGTIAPASSSSPIGHLDINTDLESTVTTGGVIAAGAIEIDAAGTDPTLADRVVVGGHASLAGALRLLLAPGFDPPAGTRFTVLTARGGISGRFDVASFPGLAGRFFRVEYNQASAREDASVTVVVESQTLGGFQGSTFASPGSPSAAALTDLDGDTFPELVLSIPDAVDPEENPGQFAVLRNQGTSSGEGGTWNGFASQQTFNTGRMPVAIAAARFRGTGQPNDIAVACAAENQIRLHLNSGTADFSPGAIVPSGGLRPIALAAADLNADGTIDLAAANFGDVNPPPDIQLPDRGNARVLLNSGAAQFTLSAALETGWYPRDIALLDANRDGLPDVVTADSGTSELSFFASVPPQGGGGGTAVYAPPVRLPTPAIPVGVEPGGLDNPKEINDLAAISIGNGGILTVFLNTNQSARTTGQIFLPGASLILNEPPIGLAALNLDEDEDTDIAVILDPPASASDDPPPSARIVRNNSVTTGPGNTVGGLVLSLEPDAVGNVSPTLILPGDVDQDGRDDLLLISPPAIARDRGGPSSIAVARSTPPCRGDLNADLDVSAGDLSILLAVFGTPALSSPQARAADLNSDGVVDTRDLVVFLGRFGTRCR